MSQKKARSNVTPIYFTIFTPTFVNTKFKIKKIGTSFYFRNI